MAAILSGFGWVGSGGKGELISLQIKYHILSHMPILFNNNLILVTSPLNLSLFRLHIWSMKSMNTTFDDGKNVNSNL